MSDKGKLSAIVFLFMLSGFMFWALDEPESLEAWQTMSSNYHP
jgi:hypothetical protein